MIVSGPFPNDDRGYCERCEVWFWRWEAEARKHPNGLGGHCVTYFVVDEAVVSDGE